MHTTPQPNTDAVPANATPVATIPPPNDDNKKMDFLPAHMRVPAAVASYSLCSGTMLLFNKLAMHYGTFRAPREGRGGPEDRREAGTWQEETQAHAIGVVPRQGLCLVHG